MIAQIQVDNAVDDRPKNFLTMLRSQAFSKQPAKELPVRIVAILFG